MVGRAEGQPRPVDRPSSRSHRRVGGDCAFPVLGPTSGAGCGGSKPHRSESGMHLWPERPTNTSSAPERNPVPCQCPDNPEPRATAFGAGWPRSGRRLAGDARWPADSRKTPEARRLADLLDYISRQFDSILLLSCRAGAAMAVVIEEFLADLIMHSKPVKAEDRALPAAWFRVRMSEESCVSAAMSCCRWQR